MIRDRGAQDVGRVGKPVDNRHEPSSLHILDNPRIPQRLHK